MSLRMAVNSMSPSLHFSWTRLLIGQCLAGLVGCLACPFTHRLVSMLSVKEDVGQICSKLHWCPVSWVGQNLLQLRSSVAAFVARRSQALSFRSIMGVLLVVVTGIIG